MFAPPPVQLSRAEIEGRRGKRKSSGVGRVGGSPARSTSTAASDPKTPSLLRAESTSPKSDLPSTSAQPPTSRRRWLFGRGGKSVNSSPAVSTPAVSSPAVLLERPGPPPEPPKQHPGDRAARSSNKEERPKTLSEAFGERPRKAPEPPRRPRRPSGGVDIPSFPGSFPVAQPATPPPQRHVPSTPTSSPGKHISGEPWLPPSSAPPPIPQKSPKRSDGVNKTSTIDPFAGPLLTEALLNDALDKLHLQNETPLHRSRNASPASTLSARKKPKVSPAKVSPGKVEKATVPSNRRSSAAAKIRSAVAESEELTSLKPPRAPRRATDSELHVRPEPLRIPDQPWKRRQKGETMSMLLDNDFFPVQEYIYSDKNPNISIKVPFPPPLSILNKELPDTPSSIVPTPTELYQLSPTRPPRTVEPKRKSPGKKRSPLANIPATNAKANSVHLPPAGLESENSPNRLSAIPEGSTVSENTPPASGLSTPVATKIHLRGGSVITLSPPELTAWRRTYYLQGAIKLPKPTILPRKGSTASMEAFQEVVDQVYQEALFIPRRRSDDQIVDDICEFFDEFSFDEVAFDGDVLGVEDEMSDAMEDIIEEDGEMERFATPPPEMEATPVEKVIAKEVVEHTMQKPSPLVLPPIETEETLRARGIARLTGPPSPTSTSSRRASMANRKDSSVLPPLLPVPEATMLNMAPVASRKSSSIASRDVEMTDVQTPVKADQGFDWDSVEELDASSAWVAPAALKESKNPVKRMRRFVASASAIL